MEGFQLRYVGLPLAKKAHIWTVKVPAWKQAQGRAHSDNAVTEFHALAQAQKVSRGSQLFFVHNATVAERCKAFGTLYWDVKQSPKHMARVKVSDNKHLLSAVIPFCSLENDLIGDVVASLAPVCRRIVLVCLTHLFTGEPDPSAYEICTQLAAKHAEVVPVLVPWNAEQGKQHQGFWPCEMRMQGFANTNTPWILMVDADEVLRDAERFAQWFDTRKHTPSTPKLANYWYFLSKRRRSKTLEDSIVLTHRSLVTLAMFRHFGMERSAFCVGKPERMVKDLEGEPMFDHFSWVREPALMRKKVVNWGHRKDRNWSELLEKAYSEDILTTPDFLHGYTYDILPESTEDKCDSDRVV